MEAALASIMVQPPAVRCLGVKLRPFSLGHYLILQRGQSPFVCEAGLPLFDDLVFAAFVMAHSWEENERLAQSKFRRWITAKTWGLFVRNANIPAEIVRLASHIQESLEIPECKETSGTPRYLCSDWPTRLLGHITTLGYTETQALDMPLRKGNLLFIAFLEQSGLADFKVKRDDIYTRALSDALETDEERAISA